MSRPGDWQLVGLWTDPTPGESWQVREIASVYGATSSAANQTGQLVRAALQASGTGIWHGQAGDAFREQLGQFPAQVEACETSYATARDAMNWWAGRLEDNQAGADRGLEQARAADADLRAAQVALDAAMSSARTTSNALEQIERNQVRYATTTPPAGWNAPTPGEIARARRAASTAATARAAAERASADAQSRLDVAARLVAEAAASYQEDAATAINRIEQATDQALPENSLWRKIYESDAWGVIVTIATVVVIVAAIAAFILTGPIAAIVGMIATIAGVLLMLNDVMAWRAGDAEGWQAALSVVLTVVPGGVLLKAGKRATSLLADTATAIAPRFTGLATGFLRTARGVASEGLLRITRITDPWVARINTAISRRPPVNVQSIADIQSWLPRINLDQVTGIPRSLDNCGSCTARVHEAFSTGTTAPSSLRTYSTPEMEAITGGHQIPMGPEEIEGALRGSGAGAHAVVGIDRRSGAGHWFNAYFDGDRVVRVDAQVNIVSDWPPTDLGDVSAWDAAIFGSHR